MAVRICLISIKSVPCTSQDMGPGHNGIIYHSSLCPFPLLFLPSSIVLCTKEMLKRCLFSSIRSIILWWSQFSDNYMSHSNTKKKSTQSWVSSHLKNFDQKRLNGTAKKAQQEFECISLTRIKGTFKKALQCAMAWAFSYLLISR